jgi:hypothetical protein
MTHIDGRRTLRGPRSRVDRGTRRVATGSTTGQLDPCTFALPLFALRWTCSTGSTTGQLDPCTFALPLFALRWTCSTGSTTGQLVLPTVRNIRAIGERHGVGPPVAGRSITNSLTFAW